MQKSGRGQGVDRLTTRHTTSPGDTLKPPQIGNGPRSCEQRSSTREDVHILVGETFRAKKIQRESVRRDAALKVRNAAHSVPRIHHRSTKALRRAHPAFTRTTQCHRWCCRPPRGPRDTREIPKHCEHTTGTHDQSIRDRPNGAPEPTQHWQARQATCS